MLAFSSVSTQPVPSAHLIRHRSIFVIAEAALALAAVAGSVQLLAGVQTPPVSDLAKLGLHSWVVPGLWLLLSVGIPSATASWLAWRRSGRTVPAVLFASGALAFELVVQIPFVGPSVLQAVLGTCAVTLAALALHTRSTSTSQPDGAGASR